MFKERLLAASPRKADIGITSRHVRYGLRPPNEAEPMRVIDLYAIAVIILVIVVPLVLFAVLVAS